MAKDINIHLKTTGAGETKQRLSEVGKSAERVGDVSRQAGEKTAAGGTKASRSIRALSRSASAASKGFKRLGAGISSWASGIVGIAATIAAITAAIRAQIAAIKEHAETAARHQKELLALQSMGTFFEEHPEARKEVAAYAEFGRRPFEEVAGAWYALESKGAGLTELQKRGIMLESLELGRMEPKADLKGIIEMFSLYAKETRQQDINLIQNVLRKTMTKAGAELSEVGKYLPEFLPLGIAAGISGPEAAGLWAYATTRAKEPGRATVGLRNVFTALLGKGTPESKELLQSLGIRPEMGFYEQIARLSAQREAGKFGVPEAEMIAGRESVAVLLSILTDPRAMMATVREVAGAARPDIDIVRERLERIMGRDKVAWLEERRRQLEVQIQNQKGRDISALEWDVILKEYEEQMREEDVSEFMIKYRLFIQWLTAGLGAEPTRIKRSMKGEQGLELFPEQPQSSEAEPPGAEASGAAAGPAEEEFTPVSVYHYYDNGIHYHPKIGESLAGPRYTQFG